jgi:hypothetical protein
MFSLKQQASIKAKHLVFSKALIMYPRIIA